MKLLVLVLCVFVFSACQAAPTPEPWGNVGVGMPFSPQPGDKFTVKVGSETYLVEFKLGEKDEQGRDTMSIDAPDNCHWNFRKPRQELICYPGNFEILVLTQGFFQAGSYRGLHESAK